MNILEIASNLTEHDGIWCSKNQTEVSYPAAANRQFFEIEENSFWFHHRNRVIGILADRFLSSNKQFVDIGGGNGFVSSYLSKKGYETVLIEPGIDGIRNARKRGVQHLIHASFQDAGFLKGALPNIGLFDVLEHIEDHASFLKQLRFVISDEGHLFITVPAFGFLWSQNDVNAGHFRRYTLKELSAVLERTGFEPVYSTYFFQFLPLGIFLFRTLPFRLGIRFRTLHKKASKEHGRSSTGPLTNLIMKREINRIRAQQSISFGSSCLIVCKKK